MASTYDLNINQGESFSLRLTAKDTAGDAINMNGYTASGHLKFRYSDSTTIADLAPTVVSGDSPGYDATGSGLIDMNLTAAQTAVLPIIEGRYDVEIHNLGGTVYRVLEGKVKINPEVTS
jgi:hypothetical protein